MTLFERPSSPSPAPRLCSRASSALDMPGGSLHRHVPHSHSSDEVAALSVKPQAGHAALPVRPASSLSAHRRSGSLGDGRGSPSPGDWKSVADGRKDRNKSKLSAALNLRDIEPVDMDEGGETSLVLHHSDSSTEDLALPRSPRSPHSPYRSQTSLTRYQPATPDQKPRDTADKAGVILGIHNVYLVLPQFIITALASFIFWVMEPETKSALEPVAGHPMAGPVLNGTLGAGALSDVEGRGQGFRLVARSAILSLVKREGAIGGEGASPDSVGLLFR